MHPRLLDYYNRELAHLRDMGAEFAQEFPKVAARLGMEGLEVSDPYVERLMEGFAFVAARIQLKLDAEFPRFTQHLLEMVYPHFLAPTPSFGIVAMRPNFSESALAGGVTVPRGSSLRSIVPRGQQTACEFRTAQPVTLFPIELTQASYFAHAADLPIAEAYPSQPVRSGLRLRLMCHGGLNFDQIAMANQALNVYINAPDDLAIPLYELMFSQCAGVMVLQNGELLGSLASDQLEGMGFDDETSLLPFGKRSFQGYRLLHEYFSFPERFLFFNVQGLAPLLQKAGGNDIELVLLFARHEPRLESALEAAHFNLYATPVVNLFERRADRVPVSEGEFEHHLVIDRTRPLDYEVFSVSRLRGFGTGERAELDFKPFYASMDHAGSPLDAYYTLRREPRLVSSRQQQAGARSSYIGTEVFVSLVDPNEAPYPETIRQLGVDVWATNRDLPLLLPVATQNPLSLDMSAPVTRITMVRGPTRPRSAVPEGDYAWRLVHHLSLNYLSLMDRDDGVHSGEGGDPGATLRGLLELYSDPANPAMRKQIDALQSVTSRAVIRRLPIPGPIAFGRGMEIDVRIDESRLPGSGGFLLGTILDRFFAQYVSINAFTQTRLISDSRAEVYRWPPRIGRKMLA